MARIQFAYIKEGPSDSVTHFYERWLYERRIYAMLSEFEDMGMNVIRVTDGEPFPGVYYYLEFDTEEEAAVFKLTHL